MVVLLVVLVLFLIKYVTFKFLSRHLFVKRPRTRFTMALLLTDVTSCCDFFPLVYCGQNLGFDCINSLSLPSSVSQYPI